LIATYAQFWKCALQVNPYSYSQTYQGKSHGLTEDAYNKAIVERCLSNDIKVVGIANHGSVDGLTKLRDALEASGIVVLPGFEIASTEKVHMVCLYPPKTDIAKLNQHLGALGLPPQGPATAPSTLSCLEISKRVQGQHGFWYAAHITGANGLLRLNQDGGGLTHIWRDCECVFAAQIPGGIDDLEQKIRPIVQNKNPDYHRTRPIALLNAKDVRKPEDLDNSRCFSWVKMTTPTLDALELACRDPESRVRLSHEVNPAYYSRIDRVVVRRGYLDDLELDLSPNLNALVGGRGTGKSTLIEAIRYALQLTPIGKDTERAHKGIIDANFAKEKACIELTITSFEQNCERYVISRCYGEPAKVLDESGKKVLNLSPSAILPRVEVYGQNELLAIVQDNTAKGKLLNRFLPDDVTAREKLAELHDSLRRNREEINELEAKVADMAHRLEQLPVLQDREKSFQKLGLEKELKQVQGREAERAHADSAAETLGAFEQAVEEFESSIDDIETPEAPDDESIVHGTILKKLDEAVEQAKQAAVSAAAQMKKTIEEAKKKFEENKSKLDEAIAADEHVFNGQLSKLPALKGKSVAQLTAEYKKVSSDIAKLKPLATQKTSLETKLLSLNQARETLLDRLSKVRSGRWSALTKAVRDLNRRLDGQLRVEFEPERIRDPLKAFFVECDLAGVGEKRLAWIDDAESLSVADVVSTLRQGADALLAHYRKAGMQKAVAEAIAALPSDKVRELEEIELPERLELMLNVVRDGENYREVGRLSTGQQCTAILHLLLLDNPDPLVIDQPEDNLDNAFIADHIVNELRVNKTKRQFMFATHNANIPVFGDAEWIGVLHEQDGQAHLQASGSIDSLEVKDLAANILEGGKEAFNRRREKYGL
jgi:DNA repair ATPase RecN